MIDSYLKHGKATVFRDTSKGGLLSQFLNDYRKQFGTGKLNPSCSSCRDTYWNNYENLFKMKETVQCDYVLKTKYNGIQLGVNGQPVRNGEMTNKIAKELLDKHPRGALLFDVIPEAKPKKAPVKKKATSSKK